MIRNNLVAAFAALAMCASASFATGLEAYGRLPTLSNITLSPDGTTIAYVRATDSKRLVVAQSVVTKQILSTGNIGDAKLRGLIWADNHTLLIITSTTEQPFGFTGHRGEYFRAQVYDLQTKTQHALLAYVGENKDVETMNVIAGFPQPRIIDGHTVVFVPGINILRARPEIFPSDVGRLALFRIDLTSNTTRTVSRPHDMNGEEWVIDGAGNIVAEASYYEKEQHWKLAIFRGGEQTNVLDVAASIDSPYLEGLNEDGTAVVVSVPQPNGDSKYQQIFLKDGSIGPWQRADMGFNGLMTDIWSGRTIGGTRITDRSDYVLFDSNAQRKWLGTRASFEGATNIELVSRSEDGTKMVVLVFGQPYGDAYFYVDVATHQASRIGSAYDGIDAVAPVKWIEYRAGDGRSLHAYITLPPNGEAKGLPLIVLPHGGPHARDEPGFDWLPQAFASRGYVVLQPQFRGSGGFGAELLEAGFGEFGKKMQTDLSDGVRALAAQGLVDPKRVCIVGGSYGGYAALAGATLDTGVYRCAVSIAGISDVRGLLRYWHWPRNSQDRNERFWDRFLGVRDLNDSKLDGISPIKHVDRVSIPILLIHGRDDTVVPFEQSDDMADALKAAKKQYEFLKLGGEDHWLSKSETRLQMLEATVRFLEANNPSN